MESVQNFKKFFLLELTKELIRNSQTDEVIKLKDLLAIMAKQEREKEEEIKREEKERVSNILKQKDFSKTEEVYEDSVLKKGDFEERRFQPLPRPFAPRIPMQRKRFFKHILPALRIPEPRLPRHLNYLRPTPSSVKSPIELGKLNSLITDSSILEIECNGANEPIYVRGTIGRKRTSIVLSEKEIDDIISNFSKMGKIPVNEGIFRVAYGNLFLSAIISEVTGTKFLIKRITPVPQPMQRFY